MKPRAANIRDAASLLVLRDGPRGVEVLLMRRPERDNDFRSGACVFPGGVLDPAERSSHAWCLGLDDAAASRRLGLSEGGLDFFIAAVRECFEEVGLLYVCRADGSAADVAAHALDGWRSRLHRNQATMAELCAAFDWRIDLRDMAYFSHWLTPVTRPKRFDTRFFVRLAAPGQQARPDGSEALELLWLTPAEALDPARALKLLNVTQQTLRAIGGFASAADAYAHALSLRGVALTFPRPALGRDDLRFVVNGEDAYDEIAHLDPEGRGELRCELQPGDVTQLSAHLWRVCGRTRHAYLVTDGAASALIGADADDAAQRQALSRLAVAPVRWFSGAAAPAAWPEAQPLPADGTQLAIGATLSLRRLPGGGWLLEAERIAIGDAAPAAGTADWLAPAQGFMRRILSER